MNNDFEFVELTKEDCSRINELSKQQSKKYGHDCGHFTLGREDSSSEIGFIGEVGLLRFFKDKYGLVEPTEIGLEEIGAKYDIYIFLDNKKYNLHVKTGRWIDWPKENWTFGVHWDQKIENSKFPVVLISFLKNNNIKIKIEGFLKAEDLAKCKIIRKGECFPNMNYPSRCDNWLTYFYQYNNILELIDYLKTID